MKDEDDQRTVATFREMFDRGRSPEHIAIGLLDALRDTVSAYMEAIPQDRVSVDLKWQIAAVAQVIDNTRAVLQIDATHVAVITAEGLPEELTNALRGIAEVLSREEDEGEENAAGKGDG